MKLLKAFAFCFALLATVGARAQENYPDHPVTFIVPYAPGGGASALAQIITKGLEAKLGQPFVIEYREGSATVIGTTAGSKAAPDGYTLLMASSAMSTNASLLDKLPYDTEGDFAPVGLIADTPLLMLASNSLGVRTVQELVDLAKSKPGDITYGSAGTGSTHQLFAEQFKKVTGVDMRHVPYKGGGPALTALLAGEISVLFSDPGPALQFIESGQIVALGVTASKPLASLPDVQPLNQLLPSFQGSAWQGVMAPKGTPEPIIDKLNKALNEVLADPEVIANLAKTGKIATPMSPSEFAEYFKADIARWRDVIASAGIKG
ncbi:MAG: tripartite tricarboxylate transporter substrate binding protein [Rhizobiaceae bacterium]|nr:tripartite tricarboxylate transporter substrate binding protein [Rhizobiaceae bacterium]